MLVSDKSISFHIFKDRIKLYSETDTCIGLNTIAEWDGVYYYLGHEQPTFSTALLFWQDHNRELTNEELHQCLLDNKLASEGV